MHRFAYDDEGSSLYTVSVLASSGISPEPSTYPTRTALGVKHCEHFATSIAPFLSHDIRHHLSVVYCNAEFMSEPATLETDRKQLFEEVKSAISSVTQILDLMILHARSGPPSQDGIESFNDLIEHTVDAIRPHPHSAGVRISIGESPSISALFNKTLVSSAVYNLLLNACFAAQQANEPGRVEISLNDDYQFVSILVKDNGSGIPARLQQTLSQPFVTSGKQGGTGLGITIAEYVAREYGGSLQIQSSRPGCTIFVLRLAKGALLAVGHVPSPTTDGAPIFGNTNDRGKSVRL
jgi:C4-dicarboxylate-specific signal transduction histidine kinase